MFEISVAILKGGDVGAQGNSEVMMVWLIVERFVKIGSLPWRYVT
jgi:hypothetical protein